MADSQDGRPRPQAELLFSSPVKPRRRKGHVALEAAEVVIGEYADYPFLEEQIIAAAADPAEPAATAIGMLKVGDNAQCGE